MIMDIVDRLQNKKRNTTDEEDDALTEIKTLRAKVASAEGLVEALREAKDVVGKYASDESEEGWIFIDAYKKITEALATYDKLSEASDDL